MTDKIVKTEAEWRAQLTPDQFRLTREIGDEPPFTGAYWDTWTPGVYQCVCCGTDLFSSEAKFDPETGWPSFSGPISGDAVWYRPDGDETEAVCTRCDASLGHRYDDGPPPTGYRYCLNSAGLALKPAIEGDDPAAEAARKEKRPIHPASTSH